MALDGMSIIGCAGWIVWRVEGRWKVGSLLLIWVGPRRRRLAWILAVAIEMVRHRYVGLANRHFAYFGLSVSVAEYRDLP